MASCIIVEALGKFNKVPIGALLYCTPNVSLFGLLPDFLALPIFRFYIYLLQCGLLLAHILLICNVTSDLGTDSCVNMYLSPL